MSLFEPGIDQTSGVSLTQFWTFCPASSLIATAAPAPPIVAGFVTAAACSFGYCTSIWCRNSLLSAPTIGTSGLPAVLNAWITV